MANRTNKSRPDQKTSTYPSPHLDELVHDLNNVLYALSGFVDIAIDDLSPGHPSYEALLEAVRAGQSAASLVEKLTLAEVVTEAPGSKKQSVKKVVPRAKFVSARRVLVIEEEPMVAELLERALQRFGFEPKVFKDAHQALAVFTASPDDFDAIITDEPSHQSTGLTVVIKMQTIRPQVPIILMTAGSESMMTSRALEAGIQHVMHKPVKIQDLCRTLEELTLTIVA